jgi:SAM-dependent methyltransferase
MTSHPITQCRSCGSDALVPVLSLGTMPLANALPREAGEQTPAFPLDVVMCGDCALAQLRHTVPPEALFADYVYFSSMSATMCEHAAALAKTLMCERQLGPDSLVLEIASNDGYLLQHLARAGIPVLGVEPAATVAAAARARGVPTREAFFGNALAEVLYDEGVRPAVIVANNVMAHVPDVNGVVAGVARLLAPGGVFVIETPYLGDLVDRGVFDTIYHEHLFYYSLTALSAVLGRNGLRVMDVSHVPIHGGSLRVTATADPDAMPRPAVLSLLARERERGLDTARALQGLATSVDRARTDLRELLVACRARGQRVAGYGAPAKATTLLNTAGIGRDLLDFVVDCSPHKQGRFIPGVDIPIVSPDTLATSGISYLLLLAWNLADEIYGQQQAFIQRGGRFIVPFPTPEIA